MSAQEEYEKIKARIEQQVKYGLPAETPSAVPSEAPEASESGWRTTEDGVKYRTVTVSDVFEENPALGKDKLLTKIERENKSMVGIYYAAGSPAEKQAQERADYANKFLGTRLVEFEKDGKTYYQTPRGEQVEKTKFLRVMQLTGRGVKIGGGSYSESPAATYMALTGEGLEKRTDADKARMTITRMESILRPLSPTSVGLETELAEIQERNIEHAIEEQLGENVLRLDTGEYVPESQWYSLSAADQEVLKSKGVQGFNQYQQEKFVESVAGQAGLNYLASLPSITEEQRQAIKLPETITAFTDNPYPQGTKEYYLFDIQKSSEMDLGEYILKTGGDYDYYKALPEAEQKAYLEERLEWKPIEGVAGGYEFDVSGGEYGKKATAFLETQEAFNQGRISEAEFKQAESAWLDYVAGAKERASKVTIPSSPIEIEKFISDAGGSIEHYQSLPKEQQQPYLDNLMVIYEKNKEAEVEQFIKNTGGDVAIYNAFATDTEKQSYLDGLYNTAVAQNTALNNAIQNLNEWKEVNEAGEVVGYKLYEITQQDLADNPSLKESIALAFPDYNVDLIGVTTVDVDGLRDSWRVRNMQWSGSSQWDTNLVMAGNIVYDPVSGQLVLPRKAVPLTDYINIKLNEVKYGKPELATSFEMRYYPTVTMTEYAHYSPEWLASVGAVIKPTITETVRMLAKVDPDTTKELSGIDALKLFGYGFSTAFELETAIALPFVASPLALVALPFAGTGMKWYYASPEERRTSLIMDGVFAGVVFGLSAFKALTYIPRELRSIFGDIGSQTLINKTVKLNEALKVSGVSDVVANKGVQTAAKDLKNLLIAAKDNGVEGLDSIIQRVSAIERNPQAFRGIGNMALTPEMENALKYGEYALRELEQHPYITGEVRMATEGVKTPEYAGVSATFKEGKVNWDGIAKSYQLRTESEAGAWSAAQREGIGLDIPRESITQIPSRAVMPNREAELSRLRSWLRSEKTSEDYPRLLEEYRQASTQYITNRIRSSDLFTPNEADEVIGKYHYLWDGVNNSARQAAQEWISKQGTGVYQDLVSQYAAREIAEAPFREALANEVRIAVARQANQAVEDAIALQLQILDTKLAQALNVLNMPLSPKATLDLLKLNGLGVMGLFISPDKVLKALSQVTPSVRNNFINSLNISDTSLIKEVTDNYDWSDKNIENIVNQSEVSALNDFTIKQEDLTQIIAVPLAEPMIATPMGEDITALPTGEVITGIPIGEQITDVPIRPSTIQPSPEIRAFRGDWEAPKEVSIIGVKEEWGKPVTEEWIAPITEEYIDHKLDTIGLPSVKEITLTEFTNLARTLDKYSVPENKMNEISYMANLINQMRVRYEEAKKIAEEYPVDVGDLPFEQRVQVERMIKQKKSVDDFYFLFPLSLLINPTLVVKSYQALPQEARMSLMEALPDNASGNAIKEGLVAPELTPELIEQIEEAAKDIWEKQLEEIINPKGDEIISPSRIEQEIEEIIRKAEEVNLPMPQYLEEELRKLLQEPYHIGKTVETPEIVTIPQITPQVSPMAIPATEVAPEVFVAPATRTDTLIRTMTEALTEAQTKTALQTKTQTQMQTRTQTETEAQSQLLAEVKAEVQAQTQAQIQAQNQVMAQAETLVQNQIKEQVLQQIAQEQQTALMIEPMEATEVTEVTETTEPLEQVIPQKPPKISTTPTVTTIDLIKPLEPFEPPKPPEEPLPPRKRIPPPIIKGSGGKPLTKEQLEGAIGWKQGIMYKYIYPPYGQEDIINSRSPIQGIPMKEGIRSAYETIIRTRPGFIPPNITRHMGMMDIKITDADKDGQPEIKFIEREGRKGRGEVRKVGPVRTNTVFTINT
jgi:hypothetical protein